MIITKCHRRALNAPSCICHSSPRSDANKRGAVGLWKPQDGRECNAGRPHYQETGAISSLVRSTSHSATSGVSPPRGICVTQSDRRIGAPSGVPLPPGKKRLADSRGEKAVDKKIVPFEHVADHTRGDHPTRSGKIDFHVPKRKRAWSGAPQPRGPLHLSKKKGTGTMAGPFNRLR